MAFASLSNEVKVHSWPQLELVDSYKPKKPTITNVSYSKDGSYFVLLPQNSFPEILVLKNSKFKLLQTISSVKQPTWATFSNTTKKNVIIGTEEGYVIIYDIKQKKILKILPKCNSGIYKTEYANKDNHLVAGCKNGDVIVFSNHSNVLSSTIKFNTSKITTFCCLNDKPNVVCLAQQNGAIKLWDIHRNKQIHSSERNVVTITNVTSPYSFPNIIIATNAINSLCIYDIRTNKLVGTLNGTFTTADVCLERQNLLCGNLDGKIATYDLRNLCDALNLSKVHNDAIKQIIFRKYLKETEMNSIIDVSEDSLKTEFDGKTTTVVNLLENPNLSFNQAKDSFLLSFDNSIDKKMENTSLEVKDSFIDSYVGSPILKDVTNSPALNENALFPNKLKEPKNNCNNKNTSTETSTPVTRTSSSKFLLDTIEESPIVEATDDLKISTKAETEKSAQTVTLTSNAYFTRLEQYMDKFKDELLWEMTQVTNSAKNTIIMSQIKENFEMQQLYSNLKADLLSDTVKIYTNVEHVQEIEALKRENIILKRENLTLAKENELLRRYSRNQKI